MLDWGLQYGALGHPLELYCSSFNDIVVTHGDEVVGIGMARASLSCPVDSTNGWYSTNLMSRLGWFVRHNPSSMIDARFNRVGVIVC